MINQNKFYKSTILLLIGVLLLSACHSTRPVPGKATLTFAVDEMNLEYFIPLVEEFNQQESSVKVILLPFDYGLNPQSFSALAASADTFLLPEGQAITSGPGSYLLDLQSLMESDASFESNDLWPGSLIACQDEQGHTLGIPLSLKIQGIFYDRVVLEDDGIATPQPGWTWDEFRNTIASLSKLEAQKPGNGFMDGDRLEVSIISPLINASLAKNDGSINPDELASAVQWYADLSQAGVIHPISSVNQSQYNEIQENKPVMWTGELGSYLPGTIAFALLQAGFVPYPISNDPGSQDTTSFIATCAAISNGSIHPQAAWKWLTYLSQHTSRMNAQAAWASIPTSQSVTESQGYWQLLPATAETSVRFALEHLDRHYSNPAANLLIQNTLLKAIKTKGSLADAFTVAKEQFLDQPASSRSPVTVSVAPPPEGMDHITLIKFVAISTGAKDDEALWGTSDTGLRVIYRKIHPEVVIVPVNIRTPENGQEMYSYLAENTDCFQWYNYQTWDAQTTGQLLDLTPIWEREDESFRQEYDANLLDRYRYEGRLYGLPGDTIPRVFVYNADLLNQLGLQAPEPGWSFDQFMQLAAQVGAADQNGRTYGYLYPIGNELLLKGRGVSGYDFNASPPTAQLNSPDMINAVTWLVDLARTRVIFPYESRNIEVSDLLTSGHVAFWESLAGSPDGGYAYQGLSFRTGEVPFPIGKDFNASSGLHRGYFISNKSANPQACWDWLKFLSEQTSITSGVPARRSVVESAAWESWVGKINANTYRLAVQQVNQSETTTNPAEGPLNAWLWQAMIAAFQGEDPQLVLMEAQRKAEAYLSCLNEQDISKLTSMEIEKISNSCREKAEQQSK